MHIVFHAYIYHLNTLQYTHNYIITIVLVQQIEIDVLYVKSDIHTL